jgi:hypothetical protein
MLASLDKLLMANRIMITTHGHSVKFFLHEAKTSLYINVYTYSQCRSHRHTPMVVSSDYYEPFECLEVVGIKVGRSWFLSDDQIKVTRNSGRFK